jgi:hypothetical protein
MELDLPYLQKLSVGGWIVRSKRSEGSQKGQQSVALEFLNLGQEKEAQLLKFLDEYQLGPGAYQLTGLYPEGAVSRRRLKRFEIKLKGTATLSSSDGTVEKEISTRTLSASGGYFVTDHAPCLGENVRIRLQWPSPVEEPDTTFEVTGPVNRIEQISEEAWGFAVEFEEIIDLDMD